MKKVLILDDEQDLISIWIAQFQLWRLQVEIHVGSNGKDGLKKLSDEGNFDLIITDYNMPEMNGLEFVKRIHTKTPIFFFTSLAKEVIPHMQEMDNVLLFEKPEVTPQMKNYIQNLLNEDLRPIEAM